MIPAVEVNGQVIYELQPKQVKALGLTPLVGDPSRETPTHLGYGGAAGGGKSHFARVVAALACLKWAGCTVVIFRRTRPEVRDNHWVKFLAEFPSEIKGQRIYSYNASDMVVTFYNGSRLIFGYLERDDHVFRYQGAEYDVMVFEEATHQSWFQVNWLTGNRLRSTVSGTKPFALYPSNPGNRGHHWYKRLFVDRRFESRRGELPSEYAFVQAKLEDNYILMERDPQYLKKLMGLEEPYRSWQLLGDWAAGAGLALDMNYDIHVIDPIQLPASTNFFCSYDWGFTHPFSFGVYAAISDGHVIKLDTISSRRRYEHEVLEMVRERMAGYDWMPRDWKPRYTHAGHDCWSDVKARIENVPTVAETFALLHWPLEKANISRVSGLNNMRRYVRYRDEQTNSYWRPRFQLVRTPGNDRCYEQLASTPCDPDNPEDALKQDADDFGEGGDDMYDETRYGLASRPIIPKEPIEPPLANQDRDDRFDQVLERLERFQNTKRGRRR